MKHIILVAATEFEILPFLSYCKKNLGIYEDHIFTNGESYIHILITGVGIANTTYCLTRYLTQWEGLITDKPAIVLQAGIAGAFNRELILGEVVEVISETWGDLGVSESDGQFTDVFEMGLLSPENFPYRQGRCWRSGPPFAKDLRQVTGLTVNRVSGEAKEIAAISTKYPCDIETMEGAAFFQVCLLEKVYFTALRAISNYVTPRNKAEWEISLAIDNLNELLIQLLCTPAKLPVLP